MSKFKIAVDAGHGFDTAGKRTPPMTQDIDMDQDGIIDVAKGAAIREHIATVGVSMLLVQELVRCGFEVIHTGFNDGNSQDEEDVSLSRRQQTIKNAECDYSISIHFNASGDGASFNSAKGIGIYIHCIYLNDSMALATKVLSYLIDGIPQKNRGVSTAELALCNCKIMNTKASILVECDFMTNLEEAINMMGNNDYWEETATEIARGICAYTGEKYIEAEIIPTKEEWVTNNKTDILYRVQVGAFRHKLGGDGLVDKVKAVGFINAFNKTTFLGGTPLYRVQIGAYSVKTNADKMLIKVKAAGFSDAFIQVY